MNPRPWFLACCLASLAAAPAARQQKPLQREFSLDGISGYGILLTVRSEVEGQELVHIGAKTYVKPFTRVAEGRLSWPATRQFFFVNAVGNAEIEETLDEFSPRERPISPRGGEGDEFEKAVSPTLSDWSHATPLTLRDRETRAGQFAGLTGDGVPTLEEASPRVVRLENWIEARGAESGEWMEANRSAAPAVRLQIAQQVFGTVANGPEEPPEATARARFHSESLNTISLADGRLLTAIRSALREVSGTLAPVEGLPRPPEFRGRLSAEIHIELCDEDPCLAPDRAGAR
jgi:hypothetical protein